HERVGYRPAGKVVRLEEPVPQRTVPELAQGQSTKEGARPTGKPFVDGDNRAVILLNLLLPQGQSGDEFYIKNFLYAHSITLAEPIAREPFGVTPEFAASLVRL